MSVRRMPSARADFLSPLLSIAVLLLLSCGMEAAAISAAAAAAGGVAAAPPSSSPWRWSVAAGPSAAVLLLEGDGLHLPPRPALPGTRLSSSRPSAAALHESLRLVAHMHSAGEHSAWLPLTDDGEHAHAVAEFALHEHSVSEQVQAAGVRTFWLAARGRPEVPVGHLTALVDGEDGRSVRAVYAAFAPPEAPRAGGPAVVHL